MSVTLPYLQKAHVTGNEFPGQRCGMTPLQAQMDGCEMVIMAVGHEVIHTLKLAVFTTTSRRQFLSRIDVLGENEYKLPDVSFRKKFGRN